MTEFEKAYLEEIRRHNEAMERIETKRNELRQRHITAFIDKGRFR